LEHTRGLRLEHRQAVEEIRILLSYWLSTWTSLSFRGAEHLQLTKTSSRTLNATHF